MPPENATASRVLAANRSTVTPVAVVAINPPPAIEAEALLREITAQLPEAPAEFPQTADELLSKLPTLPREAGDDELPPIDPDELLAEVNRQVESLPRSKDGSVQLTVQANELRYLRKCIRNAKIDEWRWVQRYYKRFDSLDQCEEANRRAEARDEKLPHRDAQAPVSDDPSVELELAEEHAASRRKVYELLRDLPLQLAVIAYALPRVKGNVSELARQLGQPQRRTARQVARIQEHLRKKGFGA